MQQCDRSYCWIRRDLRWDDHRALHEATRFSREVIPLFVFDPELIGNLPRGALRRLEFLKQSLGALDENLKKKGSGVLVVEGDPRELIPRLAREMGVNAVFWNHDYEPFAKRRDASVSRELEHAGVLWRSFKDQVVFEGSEILSGKGTPYRVFTPYERAWRKRLDADSIREYKPDFSRLVRRESAVFKRGIQAPVVERSESGHERLRGFLTRLDEYDERRDFPALHATSGLSPFLRFGELSIRGLFRLTKKRKSAGARKWESELIWREYFFMILDQFPHVQERSFNSAFEALEWPGLDEHFEAWREGRTGYPLVDAAMRCLVSTGWIHNRLRMVVATFLVKDLLIDWRRGERFFAEQLVDYELASNNGGWQWCASTGADAQPWFRIFNPVEQSRKFDSAGDFIREHCPELGSLGAKEIHFPAPEDRSRLGYPAPIVEHSVQRAKALELYGSAAKSAKKRKDQWQKY